MFKKQRAKRKFNIVVKITALALCTSMVCLEMSVLNARATSLSKAYEKAYGDENTETGLYLWHLIDNANGSKDPLNTHLSKNNTTDEATKKKPVRLLLAYQSNGGSYYVEADWTKAEFKNCNEKAVAGTCIKTVSTKDNTQVLIGDSTFITRGALRSFFAVWSGKNPSASGLEYFFAGNGPMDATNKYKLYAADESDEDIATINGAKLELCNTFGNDKNGLWFYPETGSDSPCGSSNSEDAWGDLAYQRSKFKGDNIRNQWTIYYPGPSGEQCICYFIGSVRRRSAVVPALVHSNNNDRFNKMGENQFTLAEYDDGSYDMSIESPLDSPHKWILYVGEKVGTCTNLCGTEPESDQLPSGSSLTLELPYYIRKDQTYIVRKGATLHVASLIELNGTIINYGTIIIESGGAIMGNACNSERKSSIECKGGDIIIKSGGVICVKDFYLSNGDKENGNESSYGQIITLGGKANENLKVSGSLKLEKGVFDYKTTGSGAGNDSQAKECNGITMVGYSGIGVDNGKIKYTQTKSKTVKGSDTASFTCGSGDAVIFDN